MKNSFSVPSPQPDNADIGGGGGIDPDIGGGGARGGFPKGAPGGSPWGGGGGGNGACDAGGIGLGGTPGAVVPLGVDAGGCGLVTSSGLILKYNCNCRHSNSSGFSSC